jgi:hypothetical protein
MFVLPRVIYRPANFLLDTVFVHGYFVNQEMGTKRRLVRNETPERNMTKRWTEMTTQEHVRNNNFRYAIERAQQCEREYLDTCARWKSECLADGVDPELERDYYEIDALKHRLDHALANATGYAST